MRAAAAMLLLLYFFRRYQAAIAFITTRFAAAFSIFDYAATPPYISFRRDAFAIISPLITPRCLIRLDAMLSPRR